MATMASAPQRGQKLILLTSEESLLNFAIQEGLSRRFTAQKTEISFKEILLELVKSFYLVWLVSFYFVQNKCLLK